jgi:hypothetical protein
MFAERARERERDRIMEEDFFKQVYVYMWSEQVHLALFKQFIFSSGGLNISIGSGSSSSIPQM